MNKHERILARNKVILRRAKACKWSGNLANVPEETKRALEHTGNIRISRRSDRKRFHKSKLHYGHFGGYGHNKGMGKKDLQERAEVRSHPIAENET